MSYNHNQNPYQAIRLIEDECSKKIIQSDTLMMKINMLSKYAKMIYKMFCDPLYFVEKDFGPSRLQKFDRLSSLCHINCRQAILSQLKNKIQDIDECVDFVCYPQCFNEERAMLLLLKQIMAKIDELDDNLSFNLSQNLSKYCTLQTNFCLKDLMCSNHILKMIKEENDPQNK